MSSDFLDESSPRRPTVERIKGLSLGAKIVLVGAVLLFFSLFLTWQNLEVVYEGAGTGTLMLDGWDMWGLLIGFLLVGVVRVVLVAKTGDLDLWPDVDWELVVLAAAAAVLALVVAKNLTDRNSTWASYLGLVLAGVTVAGAFLDWMRERLARYAIPRRRRKRFKSAV
jgi:TRAP-type uncharacterized transport system fused permease subunit